MAVERAVAAGADPKTVVLAEVDAMPLQYVANQVRVIARAVGDFSPDASNSDVAINSFDSEDDEVYAEEIAKQSQAPIQDPRPIVDVDTYKPKVITNLKTGHPEWFVSETDAEWMADGCYVLGCAGGGSPFSEYIKLRDRLREGYTIRIIDSSAMKADDVVYWEGHMHGFPRCLERKIICE